MPVRPRQRVGRGFNPESIPMRSRPARILVSWIAFLAQAAGTCGGAEPAPEPRDLPEIIPDDTAGAWRVDRFAGNSTAGPVFVQGPAREAGGLGRCGACPLPDGRVLVPFRGGLAEVDPAGTLRLVVESRLLFGTTGQVTAHVAAYNPVDRAVYVAGPQCVRRVVERPDGPWRIERVAGTPGRAGFDDGPVATATFTRVDSLVIDRRGAVYLLDDNRCLRKIEGGRVATLNAAARAGGGRVDGPLAQARFALIGLGGNLCAGDNDDTLYLSDHWNFAVRKIDLKAGTVSTVAGMPKPEPGLSATPRGRRYNRNADGPALTWASFNSGCAYVCWDPVHRALWCGGPDENRFRWLKAGRVLTVIGARADREWPRDGEGIPADDVRLSWNAVVGVDDRGRAYLSASGEPNGLWRAYRKGGD
jgi:hypothetical protein